MSNNQISRFVIEGILTTTSPLHITQAGTVAHLVTKHDGTLGAQPGKKTGKFPVTLTRSAAFFQETAVSTAKNEEDSGHGVSFRQQIPVIPASTWRGMLRRGAARVIEDHVIETLNTKLPYDAYQGLHCGAISGVPDGVPPSTDEIRAARRHVFYGIFGGGPRMLQGNLRASDAIPVIDRVISAGLLPETLIDHALKGVKPDELFVISPVVRKDDFYGVGASSNVADELVENFEQTYTAEREKDLQKAINRHKQNEGEQSADAAEINEAGERGVRAMSFRQDVAMGVPFRVRLDLNGTPAQVGMLLAAIDRSLPQGVGGRSALGLGRLSGTIYVRDATGNQIVAAGIQDGIVDIKEDAEPYMAAMTDEVSKLKIEDITRYMSSALSSEQKKEKAAKKAAKTGTK